MVIQKSSVEAFHNRPRKDSRKTQKASDAVLDARLDELGLTSSQPLRRAQKLSVLLCWLRKSYLVLLGMGGGKTFISLTLFQNRKKFGHAKRCLVLVPNVVNLFSWQMQVEKHTPELKCSVVSGSGADSRWQVLEGDSDLVVITYQGLVSLCSRSKKKGAKGWRLDPKACKRLASKFEMAVYDECTAFKNANSLTFKIIRNISRQISYRYGLTGTPFDKNPEDLWSQFFVIDGGYTLGETLGMYRESFFVEVESYFSTEYSFRKSETKRLTDYLCHSSIRISQEDCQDLPSQLGGLGDSSFMVRYSVMPDSTWAFQKRLVSDMKNAEGNRVSIQNSYARMRMLSSGWLGTTLEDSEEKVEIVFDNNPKFDSLFELLSEIPKDEKVVIIHWFNKTGELLSKKLKSAKMDHDWIYGKTTTKVKEKALTRFSSNKGPRVLLASTAISKGVNLQDVSRYMIFVESPDAGIERNQLEARIRREGSLPGERRYYDLCMKATMDERILDGLRTGKRLVDSIVDGKFDFSSLLAVR